MIIFLLLYGLFILFYLIFAFVAVFCALRYRMPKDFNIPMTFIFISLTISILWVTGIFIATLDWSQGVTILKFF